MRRALTTASLGRGLGPLDERLRLAEAVRGSTLALRAARHQLVLQLAAAALEDDGPLPGADAEYRRAREAQAALERHEREVDAGCMARQAEVQRFDNQIDVPPCAFRAEG